MKKCIFLNKLNGRELMRSQVCERSDQIGQKFENNNHVK